MILKIWCRIMFQSLNLIYQKPKTFESLKWVTWFTWTSVKWRQRRVKNKSIFCWIHSKVKRKNLTQSSMKYLFLAQNGIILPIRIEWREKKRGYNETFTPFAFTSPWWVFQLNVYFESFSTQKSTNGLLDALIHTILIREFLKSGLRTQFPLGHW